MNILSISHVSYFSKKNYNIVFINYLKNKTYKNSRSLLYKTIVLFKMNESVEENAKNENLFLISG